MSLNRGIVSVILPSLLCAALLGCGKQRGASPPASGEALREHLLEIIDARRQAFLAGDPKEGRSYDLPYVVAADKVFLDLMGLPFDEPPTKAQLESAAKLPPLFSPDVPVTLETADEWARLRQRRESEGDMVIATAYFRLQDGRWWVVQAATSHDGEPTDRFAYLRAHTYWPDHMDEFFFLPPVRLEVKSSSQPSDSEWFDWRLSLHVTNTGEEAISALRMKRFFTSVQYHDGESQSAAEPSGGEQLGDLKPGQTIYLGDVQIRKPVKPDPDVAFYAGPYVSKRIRPHSGHESTPARP